MPYVTASLQSWHLGIPPFVYSHGETLMVISTAEGERQRSNQGQTDTSDRMDSILATVVHLPANDVANGLLNSACVT